jgi:hypothetical protein
MSPDFDYDLNGIPHQACLSLAAERGAALSELANELLIRDIGVLEAAK